MKDGFIYKIMGADEWAVALAKGVYDGSEHDRRDGFIHFSTAEQVAETAAKHFTGQPNLVLLAVDPQSLGGALRWEASRGGAQFPHLYAPMPVAAVIESYDLPLEPGGQHRFPA